VFFPKTQFDEIVIQMLQGSFLKSYPMKFVKGWVSFAACLPICSERISEAILRLYQQHEDGIRR
jgi:hypothetical protein